MGKQTELFAAVETTPERKESDEAQHQILVKKVLVALLCLVAQGCLTPTYNFTPQADDAMGGAGGAP